MKKIRLEVPFGNESFYLPWEKILLKVIDNGTKAFEDDEFTKEIQNPTNRKISIKVEVPKNIDFIQVMEINATSPVANISALWSEKDFTQMEDLKKVSIILDDRKHDVPVVDKRPDLSDWEHYRNYEMNGWLFTKKWALVIYTFDNKITGEFHWHPILIN